MYTRTRFPGARGCSMLLLKSATTVRDRLRWTSLLRALGRPGDGGSSWLLVARVTCGAGLVAAVTVAPGVVAANSLTLSHSWPFDGSTGTITPDVVGANNGTLVNSPSFVTGITDNALEFDGAVRSVDLA